MASSQHNLKQEIVMASCRCTKRNCWTLGAALALAATNAIAAASAPQLPLQADLDGDAENTTRPVGLVGPRSDTPSEAGVRQAAAQGSEALRRYVWRTRMIYNYYFWDFAKRQ
jgi:hypothetical protein